MRTLQHSHYFEMEEPNNFRQSILKNNNSKSFDTTNDEIMKCHNKSLYNIWYLLPLT